MKFENLKKLPTDTLRLRAYILGPKIQKDFASQGAQRAHNRGEAYSPLVNRIDEYDAIKEILSGRLGESGLSKWEEYCNDNKLDPTHTGFDCGA